MSVFFNPRTQKVRPWVYVFVLLVPLLMILVGIWGGKKIVEKRAEQNNHQEVEEKDIFD